MNELKAIPMGKAAKSWSQSKDYPNGVHESLSVEECSYKGKTVFICTKTQSGPKKHDDGGEGWDYDSDSDDHFWKKQKYISDTNPIENNDPIAILEKYLGRG